MSQLFSFVSVMVLFVFHVVPLSNKAPFASGKREHCSGVLVFDI